MKASFRLAERNDLLEVITVIDGELKALSDDKSFRSAQEAREKLATRQALCQELNLLGFDAPELDERLQRENGRASGRDSDSRRGDRVGTGEVLAKRRIGPASA